MKILGVTGSPSSRSFLKFFLPRFGGGRRYLLVAAWCKLLKYGEEKDV